MMACVESFKVHKHLCVCVCVCKTVLHTGGGARGGHRGVVLGGPA